MPPLLRSLLLALFVSISTLAWAGFIRGQVRYENGQPADNVIIRLRSELVAYQAEMSTDSQGKFNFDGLPLKTFHLTIEGQGFKPYSSTIDISVSRMAYELITLRLDKQPDAKPVPPEGPNSSVSAKDAAAPDNAQQEFTKGQKLLMQDHQPHDSVAHLQRAVEMYPSYTSAYVLLGMALFQDGKPQEAHAALDKAMTIDPTAAAPYIMLGMLQNQERDFPGAEKSLTRGVELDPNAPEARYELAKACFAQGKWQDAEPHAQKAVAIMPAMAPAHVLLGNIALKKKDGAGAIREFKEYLKLDPQGPMAPGVTQMVQKLEQSAQTPQ
jgi:Flp pilus assembly protein TadD